MIQRLWAFLTRLFATLKRWLFGQWYKIHLNGVYIGKVKTRARKVEVEISPGHLEGGNGTGVLWVDPSPPGGAAVQVTYTTSEEVGEAQPDAATDR